MPTARAVRKWPASCTNTSSARPRMAMPTLMRRSRDGQASFGEPAGVGVRLLELGEIACGCAVDGPEGVLDRLCDAEERQPAVEERGDGDLVRGVVGAGIAAAPLAGLAGQAEHRE